MTCCYHGLAIAHNILPGTSISAGISCSDSDVGANAAISYAITDGNDNSGLIPFQFGTGSDITIDNPVNKTVLTYNSI